MSRGHKQTDLIILDFAKAFERYSALNIHEICLRLFEGEHSLHIRAKMTSFVDSHDWHLVLVCLIEKMDHSPFEL